MILNNINKDRAVKGRASPPARKGTGMFGNRMPSSSPPASPAGRFIPMSPAMDAKMPSAFSAGQRPSTSPVLAAISGTSWETVMKKGSNGDNNHLSAPNKAMPSPSASGIICPSPALVALNHLDKGNSGFGGGVVVGLASVPTSVLCCPADKRRWSSLTISLQSYGKDDSEQCFSPSDSEDEFRAPGMVRSESFDSADVDLVWSPSGRVCSSLESDQPFPLNMAYSFYFDAGRKGKSKKVKDAAEYAQSLVEMVDVTTVQGFWQFWNAVDVDNMPKGSDFSIFKKGVAPCWESPDNENGGRWIITGFQDVDAAKHLLNVVLTFIGLQFGDFQQQMNGVVLSTRKQGTRISLWNSYVCYEAFEPVDCALRMLVEDLDVQVEYRSHNQAIVQNMQARKQQVEGEKEEATRWGEKELEWRQKQSNLTAQEFNNWREQNALYGGEGLSNAYQGYY